MELLSERLEEVLDGAARRLVTLRHVRSSSLKMSLSSSSRLNYLQTCREGQLLLSVLTIPNQELTSLPIYS